MVRLQTFIAERRRAFGRVVPLTAIERFWPASYGSLQWKDSLPGWTVGSWRSWLVINQIFMVRESAAAVRLLYVIMLDEIRPTRQSVKCAQVARQVA